ncbi:hypothetical protein [Clostridium ganghwense]|nr:hypothetical protein [Clostridium ganghwense]
MEQLRIESGKLRILCFSKVLIKINTLYDFKSKGGESWNIKTQLFNM